MSTYTKLLFQIVFGAKYNVKFLDDSNQKLLFSYMAGICNNKRIIPFAIDGYQDHIHMILDFHPAISISGFVKDVKISTNLFMKENSGLFRNFSAWQVGYSAFSYSPEAKENLIKYVYGQAEHHRKRTFKEELIELYMELGIEYEEKYLII